MSDTPPPTDPAEQESEKSTDADGTFEVQRLHDAVIQEHQEPRDGFEPIPFWALILFAGLLMWGGYYIGVGSGQFEPEIQDRMHPPQVKPAPPPPKTQVDKAEPDAEPEPPANP